MICVCLIDDMGMKQVVDITSWEKSALLLSIKGEDIGRPSFNIQEMITYVNKNKKNNAQIWQFTLDKSIDHSTLIDLCKNNSTEMIEKIKDTGKQIL